MMDAVQPLPTPRRDLLRPLRYLWRVPLILLLVLGGSLLGIFLLPARRGEASIGNRLIRVWSRWFLRLFGLRVRSVGPPLPDPVMFVANHSSWFDITVLHTQRAAGFVAKAEIARWPLVNWMARKGGTLFHRRGSTQSLGATMALMSARLRDRRSVAAFPEGGTGPGDALRVFHARIFQAALDANAPVQPVAIRYMHDGVTWLGPAFRPGESFLGNVLRMLGTRAFEAEVHFLDPVICGAEGRRRMADDARTRIAQALGIAP